ncbi:ABC transporter substrate-binding protein [Salinicoccus sp. HZC-1]|uniref:ABC transporter substrate-binding protein n=1 Tax=Salinicoccus sp. HZC-1 TaxID=3385497 RepID=UPI00398B367A
MDRIKGILIPVIVLMMAACGAPDNDGDTRIVSLMPSNTEIIAELGLADQFVSVTTEDDYPASVVDDESLVKLNTFELDEEQLIGLSPTHIVAHASSAPMHQDILDRVSEATGADVLVVEDASDIEGIYDSIRKIGGFFDVPEKAEKVIGDIAKEMGNLKEQYSSEEPEAAFIHISAHPEIYTAGDGTFIDDALGWINVENAFDDMEGYPNVSAEAVVERDPDILVSLRGLEDKALAQSIRDIPGLDGLAISEPENQCNVDPDLISRPGPRSAEGLKAVGQCVYE